MAYCRAVNHQCSSDITMAERPSQQKDRIIPKLGCALCQDRKLKCDKPDTCTNCTSSGLVCVCVAVYGLVSHSEGKQIMYFYFDNWPRMVGCALC